MWETISNWIVFISFWFMFMLIFAILIKFNNCMDKYLTNQD